MQALGSIGFVAAGIGALTAISISLYTALPARVLACAERHGRFQGLRVQETLATGTRARLPPIGRTMALAE